MPPRNLKTTVTDLQICTRCPRLAGKSLGGDGGAWRVGIQGGGVFRGRLFHDDLAAPFHRDAAGHGDTTRRQDLIRLLDRHRDTLSDELPLWLRDHYFVPLIEAKGQTLTPEETVALALGVERYGKALARFLAPLLAEKTAERLVDLCFHPPETLLKAVHRYADGRELEVTGRYDALLFDPQAGELLLVELKGYRPTDPGREMAQIALYAWLIHETTRLIPRAWILYVDDGDQPVEFEWQAMQSVMGNLPKLFEIMRDVIDKKPLPRASDPSLCEQCHHRDKCENDLAESQRAETVRKTPNAIEADASAPHPEATAEAEHRMGELVQALGQFDIAVRPDGFIAGPRFMRLRVVPDISQKVTVAKIVNKAADLQVALALKSPPLIQPQDGYVSVDIPRGNRTPLVLDEVLRDRARNQPASDGALPLGVGIDGTLFWVDLAEPTMTSMLIGGAAGSGKSVLLRSIVVGLGLCAPRDSVQFTLVDPKRVTFTDFTDLPCLDGPVLMDIEPAIERLQEIVDEMEDRYRLLQETRHQDLKSYNAAAKERLFRRVVIIDEYADMIIDKTTRPRIETAIQRLGQKGRAAGMHLVLATQRPDAKVVTGLVKANLQLKVAMKVTTRSNSAIILDQGGAEYLVGNGDMLIGGAFPVQRLQGPLVTKTEIDLLRAKYDS